MDKIDFKKILPFAAIGLGALIIIIVIIAVFANRGSNTSNEQVEIEMWGLWEKPGIMEPLIEEYEKDHPNVKINYADRNPTNYKDTLDSRLDETTSPGPDIVIMHNSWLPNFQDKLDPMPSSVMSRDEYSKTFYSTALDDFTGTDGDLYAIPLMIDGLGMFYNKELLAKKGITTPPDDWDKFTEVAKQLTEKDAKGDIKVAGAAIGTGNNINHSFDLLSVLMLQNNVKMMSADGLTATFASDSERGAATLDFYTDFANPDKAEFVWSDALGNDLELFAKGEVAIMFAPSWRVFDVLALNPTLDFDVAPIPQLASSDETVNPNINWASYWAYGVSAKADNPEEAWKFLQYLSEKETQKKFFAEAVKQERVFGEIYSRKDLNDLLKDQQFTDAYATMAPTARDWPMGDDFKATEVLNNAIDQKLGGTDSDSALEEAAIELTNHLGGDPNQARN